MKFVPALGDRAPSLPALAALAALLGASALGWACTTERRVVYSTPRLLENVAGAMEGGEEVSLRKQREAEAQRAAIAKATGTDGARSAGSDVSADSLDQSALGRGGAAPADPLVEAQRDGSVRLVAGNKRDVIALLARVINGEDALDAAFYEQLVADATKEHFRGQGKQPRDEVMGFLRASRSDLNKLLARLPGAENSPGVIVTVAGRNQWVLELTGPTSRGLKLTELWMALEGGQWKFMWAR